MSVFISTFEWRQHPRRPNWEQLWIVAPCKMCGGGVMAKPFTETWFDETSIRCEKCGHHTHLWMLPEAPCDWSVEWRDVPGITERVDNVQPWRQPAARFSSRCHECGFELHDIVDCPRCGWKGGGFSENIVKKVEALIHEATVPRIILDRGGHHRMVCVCSCCGDDINVFHNDKDLRCRRCQTRIKDIELITNFRKTWQTLVV